MGIYKSVYTYIYTQIQKWTEIRPRKADVGSWLTNERKSEKHRLHLYSYDLRGDSSLRSRWVYETRSPAFGEREQERLAHEIDRCEDDRTWRQVQNKKPPFGPIADHKSRTWSPWALETFSHIVHFCTSIRIYYIYGNI